MYQELLTLLKGQGSIHFDECIEPLTNESTYSRVRVWAVEAYGQRVFIMDSDQEWWPLHPSQPFDCAIATEIYKHLQLKAA